MKMRKFQNKRYFTGDGDYYILIIPSSNLLRWPYSKHSDPPKYKTEKEARKVIKDYVNFSNSCDDTKHKRVEAEFEVVLVKDYKQN